jgi:putative tryptophan/tyrosine transport system substrate-binding protein
MDRRAFVGAIGCGLLASAHVVRAQNASIPVIGFLCGQSLEPWALYVAAFRAGLNETGYVDGKNVAIEFRSAEGHYDRLPALAADLVRRQVAVLVAAGGGVREAKAATASIPIVFTTGNDPVEAGLVASFAHPGGNATGVSFVTTELPAKRLELLHQLVPKATVIAMIMNPGSANPGNAERRVRNVQEAARSLGLRLEVVQARAEADIDAAFETVTQLRAGAVLVDSDPFFNGRREQVVALAARHAVPAMYDARAFVVAGGLMTYGGSLTEVYRQAGIYTGKILNGAKPADLPIMQPTKVELVINLKTAKALGLTIPQSVLLRADEVIQ